MKIQLHLTTILQWIEPKFVKSHLDFLMENPCKRPLMKVRGKAGKNRRLTEIEQIIWGYFKMFMLVDLQCQLEEGQSLM